MKVEILKIKIRLGDVEQEMTVEEARDLLAQLKKLFGETVVAFLPERIIIEREVVWPSYPQPYWINPYPPSTTPQYPEITCLVTGSSP